MPVFNEQSIQLLPKAGRYAPSPTGNLHLGNLATALAAYRHANKNQRHFILRIEDIDELRSDKNLVAQIQKDLYAIGVVFDESPDKPGLSQPYFQSERKDYYQQAFDFLKQKNLIYPCYCSRKEIQQQQQRMNLSGNIYPGTCCEKTMSCDNTEQECAWRFKINQADIEFYDHYLDKKFSFNFDKLGGDFIVKRRDGFFAYQLAVVVDDILMHVVDVLRGQDLLDNTPWQILLYHALEHSALIPNYFHTPLILNRQGNKLSKRNKDNNLDYWLAQGHQLDHIINALGKFSAI